MVDFTDAKVSGPITRPWYIVEVQLGQRIARFSTGAEAYWNDLTFEAGQIAEGGLEADDNSLRLRIINNDFELSAAALRGDFHGGDIRAWYAPQDPGSFWQFLPEGYVLPGYEEGQAVIVPQQIFDGKVSEVTEIGAAIGITALRKKLGGFPAVRITTPLVNHTALPGTRITYQNRIYLIDRR